MKNKLFILLICLAALCNSACEKVIDIDLDKVEKKYVIEGWLTDQVGDARVSISRTKDFSDNNNIDAISGATVTVTDNDGQTIDFSETAAGIYTAPALSGISGKTYTLSVKINDQTYTATSTMPAKINMDTLYITEDYLFGELRKNANVEYQDPPGKGQHYRFIRYINGVKSKGIYIENDDYNDGNRPIVKLRSRGGDDEEEIKSGDIVKVEMLCIDEAVHDYWYSFLVSGATGDNNTASPANPQSNISGGILGYFSAQTLQSKTVTVP